MVHHYVLLLVLLAQSQGDRQLEQGQRRSLTHHYHWYRLLLQGWPTQWPPNNQRLYESGLRAWYPPVGPVLMMMSSLRPMQPYCCKMYWGHWLQKNSELLQVAVSTVGVLSRKNIISPYSSHDQMLLAWFQTEEFACVDWMGHHRHLMSLSCQ